MRPTIRSLEYPPAERLDVVEDLHGHRVADPYRWLEDANDPRTRRWSAGQKELAATELAALPGREALARRLEPLLRTGTVGPPVWRAGRAFFTRREPDAEHPLLYLQDRDGTRRPLVDVDTLDPSGMTTLDDWWPSREGAELAYTLSVGGDEEARLYVLDVVTGDLLEGPIGRVKAGDLAWLAGGKEYIYVRRLPADMVPAGEEHFHRRVWRHRVGAAPDTEDALLFGAGRDPASFYSLAASRDGRWLLVTANTGPACRNDAWLFDLKAGQQTPRQILDAAAGHRLIGSFAPDGRLLLLTTHSAPRWRLCSADPLRPGPADWTEVIAEEPDSVLRAVCWLSAGPGAEPELVALRTRHAVGEVHRYSLEGTQRGQIRLPGPGHVTGLTTVDELTAVGAGVVWIGWTDFVTPPGVYTANGDAAVLCEPPPGASDISGIRAEQVAYRSKDGTAVRMFVLSPAEVTGPRPALLTGYGGFAISRRPEYTPAALAWVASGGVWALALLRGGAEEGAAWHHAGMREHRQKAYDDFHAAADHLVATGRTTHQQLAIQGSSNGGLLAGVAITQRPDAYAAAVCSAPLLDMARYERFLIGRAWSDEYGTADDPTQLGWLLAYSPYHHVRPATAYPAVLFVVFASDSRVDPCHARKMCAALQHASTGGPVLLRTETGTGHAGRSVTRLLQLRADELAFLANTTGLALDPGYSEA